MFPRLADSRVYPAYASYQEALNDWSHMDERHITDGQVKTRLKGAGPKATRGVSSRGTMTATGTGATTDVFHPGVEGHRAMATSDGSFQ